MTYVFEEVISFNPKNRCLMHIKTNDEVSVSSSGCALLEYLIDHQGSIVSRNNLLDDVFKKNHHTDSSCNLSQSISTLRKGFRDLGIHNEILVTYPRVGLMLPETVKVECRLVKGKKPFLFSVTKTDLYKRQLFS